MTPPRLATRLLSFWLHGDDLDEIIGDLDEQFDARQRTEGTRNARRWYWRQTLQVCRRHRWRRRIGEELPRHRYRDAAAGLWMDARFGWRLLARSPRFAAATVVTLALGIGLSTSTYAVVYGVLLRPLPVRDDASLAIVYSASDGVHDSSPISFPRYQDWRQTAAFADLAGVGFQRADLAGPEGAERVMLAMVTDNFFATLGVAAAVGRVWTAADRDAPEIPAVISDALWRRRFAGDPAILGRTLHAGTRHLVIVGVMPPRFERWRREAHIWAPVERMETPRVLGSRGYMIITPVGRVPPGVSFDRIRVSLDAADQTVERRSGMDGSARLVSLRDDVVDARFGRLLVLIMAAVALTWLVVCANIATLSLARGARRAPEVAIRLAVGADRARIVRQVLVESLVLALPSGVLGILFAAWAVGALVVASPAGLLDAGAVSLDLPVLAFAVVLTAVSAALFGVLPAIRASAANLRTGVEDRAPRRRWSSPVVAAEVATSVTVLVGAALLVQSLVNIERVPLGFDPAPVLTARVTLPSAKYGTSKGTADARYLPAQQALLQRLGAVAGVDAVSFGGVIFIAGADGRGSVAFEGGRHVLNGNPKDRAVAPGQHFIGPSYMRVHGARIVTGREFTDADHFGAPRVVLVNETMARIHWPGESAIGQRVNFGYFSPRDGFDEPWAEVVGIVADIRHGGVTIAAKPDVYRSAMQYPRQEFDLQLRTTMAPNTLVRAVRDELRAFDPDVPVIAIQPLADVVDAANATTRYSSRLMSGLAGITAVLAAFGVFSLLAQATAARRREIGIRMALGADRRRVATEISRQAAGIIAVGLALGLAGAWYGARGLEAVLFGVAPADPAVLGGATVAIGVVAVLAAYIPARRAARLDPVAALR